MTDPEARLRGQIAANARWARESDRLAATRPMRDGLYAKFQREAREHLGPDASDEAVEAAAENARRAHLARMQLKSLKSRRANAEVRKQLAADALRRTESLLRA